MNPERQTPRDHLLARHATATPQLDALRRAALPAPASAPALGWREVLRELFRPHRAAWCSLAATWVLLALFHFTHPRPVRDPAAVAPSPAALAAWLGQFSTHDTLAQVDPHP